MFASATRTALLFVAGTMLAVATSLALARRMTAPIRMLKTAPGASATAPGGTCRDPQRRRTRALADQFNRMARKLRDSHAELEQKVEDRTHQLEEANRAKGALPGRGEP